ncbi:hypothetical protein ACS15_5247 [Ralstonia insidiosa]|uniref:Uncharacterized protein n=1 Tax=Ralstonia insidiosa TaxID=190721 RepID=A0AAC9FTU1_9RALS|nr:hypothetical protein ACS15_5247 [Ralstonia insidiosa]
MKPAVAKAQWPAAPFAALPRTHPILSPDGDDFRTRGECTLVPLVDN